MRAADLLAAARAEGQAPAADKGRPGPRLTAAQAEAEDGARIGAAVQRKVAAAADREAEALADGLAADRRRTWADAQGRTIGADPARYTAADLAALAEAAVTRAEAGAARINRRGRLSEDERAALAAEAVVMILAAQAEAAPSGAEADAAQVAALAVHQGGQARAARLPRRGDLAAALAPDQRAALKADREAGARTWRDPAGKVAGKGRRLAGGSAAAARIDGGDLAALTVLIGRLILSNTDQTWRDVARAGGRRQVVSIEAAAEAAESAEADDTGAADLLAQAAEAAEGNGPPPTNRRPADAGRSWPLAAATSAALYLSGLTRRPRVAVAQALTADRSSAADWAAVRDGQGAASATAWQVAGSKGRAALRAALAAEATRRPTAEALAQVAEAEDGQADQGRRRRAAEAEDLARLAPAPDAAHTARGRRLILAAYPDRLARRLARLYREAPAARPDPLALALARTAEAVAQVGQAAPTSATEAAEYRAARVAETVAARAAQVDRRRVAVRAAAADRRRRRTRPLTAADRGPTVAAAEADAARLAEAVPAPPTAAETRAADRRRQAAEAHATRAAQAAADQARRLAAETDKARRWREGLAVSPEREAQLLAGR